MSLGIIDWGIGGISIVKLIKEHLVDVPVIYFSDTGATPYGKMSRRELVERLDAVIEFLKKRGMTRLVIGCNAASTVIPSLEDHGIPIDGVIETAVIETLKARPERLGLIGGRRTVLSGAYRRAFAASGVHVTQRIAQPLSGLIESGDLSSRRLHAECGRILRPLKHCSHILLACTHYVAIGHVLKQHVSPATTFIDPVPALVRKLSRSELPNGTRDVYLTTGDTRAMTKAAKNAFGWTIKSPSNVAV